MEKRYHEFRQNQSSNNKDLAKQDTQLRHWSRRDFLKAAGIAAAVGAAEIALQPKEKLENVKETGGVSPDVEGVESETEDLTPLEAQIFNDLDSLSLKQLSVKQIRTLLKQIFLDQFNAVITSAKLDMNFLRLSTKEKTLIESEIYSEDARHGKIHPRLPVQMAYGEVKDTVMKTGLVTEVYNRLKHFCAKVLKIENTLDKDKDKSKQATIIGGIGGFEAIKQAHDLRERGVKLSDIPQVFERERVKPSVESEVTSKSLAEARSLVNSLADRIYDDVFFNPQNSKIFFRKDDFNQKINYLADKKGYKLPVASHRYPGLTQFTYTAAKLALETKSNPYLNFPDDFE